MNFLNDYTSNPTKMELKSVIGLRELAMKLFGKLEIKMMLM